MKQLCFVTTVVVVFGFVFALCCFPVILIDAETIEAKFQNRTIFVSHLSGKTAKTSDDLRKIQEQIRNESLVALDELSNESKQHFKTVANHTFVRGHWEPLLATEYLDFFRTGNIERHKARVSAHRVRLSQLMLGHLLDRLENSTSELYIDSIVDGLYMMLEESTWVAPEHLHLQKSADPLPDLERFVLDLNSGDDAKLVAWVKLLFGDYFERKLPGLNRRIDYELRRRLFGPYINGTFSWTGLNGRDHVVNNWNIWINTNILKTAMLTLENDEQLFAIVANRTIYSADFFLDNYGDDGGCDEGPAYWRQAAGRLIEYLEILDRLYGAADYFRAVPLFRLMGEYSYKMNIHDNWYVNFADSVPEINYPPSLIAKYGELFNDNTMKHFASYVLRRSFQNSTNYLKSSAKDFNEFWNFLSIRKEIEKELPIAPRPDTVWFKNIEVAVVRSKAEFIFENKKQSLFLATKAGTNDESHNHNDVGSFVLYLNSQPMLIDIGVGTYTANTFGAHRYDLFYVNSDYHNCPTINGIRQNAGKTFRSHQTRYQNKHETVSLTTDIAGTYPPEAAVHSWNRTIEFNRTSNWIRIQDEFLLENFLKPQQLHFLTPEETKWNKVDGGVEMVDKTGLAKLRMEFDWNVFELVELNKSLDGDKHLTKIWGETVKRLTLVSKQQYKETKGKFDVRFVPQ